MRVLQWIVARCAGHAPEVETPLGLMPEYDDLNWEGLDFGPERYAQVTAIVPDQWVRELKSHEELFAKIGREASQGARARIRSTGGAPDGVIAH